MAQPLKRTVYEAKKKIAELIKKMKEEDRKLIKLDKKLNELYKLEHKALSDLINLKDTFYSLRQLDNPCQKGDNMVGRKASTTKKTTIKKGKK